MKVFTPLLRQPWVLTLSLLAALAGCAHHKTQTRSAQPDEQEPPLKGGEVRTVGDVSVMANAEPVPVSGVGIVVGLEGTGGPAPAGGFRTMLEAQLAKMGVQHVKEIMASRDNSLVLVSALIPPGAQKDDPVDLEITLPDGSRTTSLRGGFLKECLLYNYDSKRNVGTAVKAVTNDTYSGPDGMLLGIPVARAEGPVLVGFGSGDDTTRQRQGRVWGGGRCRVPRPFMIVLNKPYDRASVAQHVAERINETFHAAYEGPLSDVASAKTNDLVYLRVPAQYRYNLPRYLRVIRQVPYDEGPTGAAPYRLRLQQEVLDPAHAVTAALRLEALGRDSAEVLKPALASPSPLVRFCAAEALAYLGDPACGEPLAELTRYEALRSYCLTALASLDEAICHVKLQELMALPSAPTRYGAFRALYSLDEHEPAVQGEQLNDSFWVHHVAPDSPALVHVSSNRRAEVVLFGDVPRLLPPFSFLAGEFTITAARDDQRCTVSRFSVRQGAHRHQCSLSLEDIFHTMADMGAGYPEVFEFLRQADSCHSLTCPVACDALPQAASVLDLARAGAGQTPDNLPDDIRSALDELGSTPTLYAAGRHR